MQNLLIFAHFFLFVIIDEIQDIQDIESRFPRNQSNIQKENRKKYELRKLFLFRCKKRETFHCVEKTASFVDCLE